MSSDLDNFVGLSSALTGIPTDRLAPAIDQVGLPPTFLAFITSRITPDVLNTLLTQYATLAADHVPPDKIAQAVLMDGSRPAVTQTAQAARSIMKLWLLGVWYQPYATGSYQSTDSTVVSDQAYIQSWAWKIAQAHPMGYSEMFFGYWNTTPPSLEDYTGVPANGQGASS
ncbi:MULTISPECIES: sorbitol dehydrogenase [Pseudomonas]|uniref:sorbitol dehydrogenase n=1 Tax=Pseudomonas TaxID=286 RepID=UPI001BE6585E|nr:MULTISPECIES: sorbitol dehydrogenase [Pseudomonas]MBT2341000.1 sorbitol dehydrogenase [Pseudomonas fluorescens]MCD4529780.1 sorbitol dehydrogenase [Pseudomonas sp. C3-2018]